MSNSIQNIQKVYVEVESTFATHDGDFSGSGVKLRPKEVVDTSGIFTNMVTDYRTLETRDDVVAPVEGAKEQKFTVPHALAGNTRSAGDVTEDGLSTFLAFIGARDTSVSDACDTGTTTTNLVLTSAGSYAVDDLVSVAIGGKEYVRIVTAVNGTTDITVAPPLPSAPVATAVISNMEWFKHSASTALSSFATGIEGDDSEMKWLVKGCAITALTVDAFKSNEAVFFSAEIEGADHTRGATLTAPSTVAPSSPVVASAGDGLVLEDAVDALWEPCPGEINVGGIIKNGFTMGPGATNGKCGVVALNVPSEERKCTLTLYQDGTFSKLEALSGIATPIVITMGDTLGDICGIAIPNAYIYEWPKSAEVDTLNAVQVVFTMDEALVFRG